MSDTTSTAVATGLEANARLSDPAVRSAADRATRATNGRVYFGYATVPSNTTYYVWQPDGSRLNRKQSLEYLLAQEAIG